MAASILFVHHRAELGGAPTSLAYLISNLDRSRFDPYVFCPGGPAARLFAEAGATVYQGPVAIFAHSWDATYRGARWLICLRELAMLLPHRRALKKVLASGKFEIVHLNDAPLLPSASLAHRYAKVVWHLRGALAHDGAGARGLVVRALIERWGDVAVAIDEDVARSFRLRIPMTVAHNAAEARPGPSPAEAKKALGLPTDRVAVGFSGFVRRQKGWPELVRAARLVLDVEPNVHFVVIGGGIRSPGYFRTRRGRLYSALGLLSDEESEMRALVEELGLTGHFTFLPFAADPSIAYRAVDVMTFPNQGVGLGRPVIEAAVYGKPVVAAGSRSGAGIVIPGVTGILLPEATSAALAETILQLARDESLRLRLGSAAAEHARSAFDPRRSVALVERLYSGLIASNGRGSGPRECRRVESR